MKSRKNQIFTLQCLAVHPRNNVWINTSFSRTSNQFLIEYSCYLCYVVFIQIIWNQRMEYVCVSKLRPKLNSSARKLTTMRYAPSSAIPGPDSPLELSIQSTPISVIRTLIMNGRLITKHILFYQDVQVSQMLHFFI